MNDPATLSGQPRTLTVAGTDYKVYPLTLADFGAYQAWINDQFPDPIAAVAAKLDDFPPPIQKHMLTVAIEQASKPKPRLGTPEADAIARSVDGVLELLRLSIAKGDPSFGPAKARALYAQMNIGHLASAFEATGAEAVLSDPKAPATTGAA